MSQILSACRCIRRVLLFVLIVGLGGVAAPLAAQILYGSIVGVVKDAQGGLVPGATVTVVNRSTNLTREVVTDAQGAFNFVNVLPGPYDV